MSKVFYRCENEYGTDPCEWAKSNRQIPQSEVPSSLGGGIPKCSGRTLNGNICNSELIPIIIRVPWWKLIIDKLKERAPYVAAAVALLLVAGGIAYMWWPRGVPVLQASPNPLVFPLAKAGEVTANITIRNVGTGELVIDKLQTSPALFSVAGEKISVNEKESTKLSVRFNSQTNQMTEGDLVLHSNDDKSGTITIKLIANRDPWWVYRKLEATSKTLQKEQ